MREKLRNIVEHREQNREELNEFVTLIRTFVKYEKGERYINEMFVDIYSRFGSMNSKKRNFTKHSKSFLE